MESFRIALVFLTCAIVSVLYAMPLPKAHTGQSISVDVPIEPVGVPRLALELFAKVIAPGFQLQSLPSLRSSSDIYPTVRMQCASPSIVPEGDDLVVLVNLTSDIPVHVTVSVEAPGMKPERQSLTFLALPDRDNVERLAVSGTPGTKVLLIRGEVNVQEINKRALEILSLTEAPASFDRLARELKSRMSRAAQLTVMRSTTTELTVRIYEHRIMGLTVRQLELLRTVAAFIGTPVLLAGIWGWLARWRPYEARRRPGF